jgi:ferredoxin
MKRGRPRWNTRCVACNRCINLCPSKSIVTSTLALGLQLSFAILSVAAALSFPLSDELHILGRGAVRAAALVALTIFQLGPYSWLLARISRGKRSRRAFEASFMADYRRYLAPDFKPTGTE